jgi:hypothetical protein
VLLSLGVAVTGFGFLNHVTWLPNLSPSGTSEDTRSRLGWLLIVSGSVGVITCTALYIVHRRKVKELDRDPPKSHFAVCMASDSPTEGIQYRKLYEITRHARTEKQQQVEIVNDRGEKKVYPAEHFAIIEIDSISSSK